MKLLVAAVASLVLSLSCAGQGFTPVEAHIASVSGPVYFSGGPAQPSIAATRGLALAPGNILTTADAGRAVVALSDGSIVVLEPSSVITFKDFRQAASLRELFQISLGQVRVKINHFAGRPNPYRMNSPTASIAVRGTEFSIAVDASGKTSVVVIEGSVEVTSLNDASQRILLKAGQGVQLTPGFALQLFTPAARDLDTHARADHSGPNNPAQASGQTTDRDQPSPRSQPGTYQLYIAGLESLASLPLLLRYNALPEAYLDSAENPAYATQFAEAQARLYLLPSLRGTPDSLENPVTNGGSATAPGDYALSAQLAGYVPVWKGRFVLGGTATGSYYSDRTGGSSIDSVDPGNLRSVTGPTPEGSVGKSLSRFLSGSVQLASKWGLNSFGVQAETLRGTGSLSSTYLDMDPSSSTVRDSRTRSDIRQTRFTLGYTRDLPHHHTLGAFARYGLVDARSQDVFNLINDVALPLSRTTSPGHTVELAVRLRGQLTPRFYYGVETAWLGLSLRDTLTTTATPASQQQDHARRVSSGAGFGYLLGRKTLLAGDFAFGLSNISALRREQNDGLLLQSGDSRSHFESFHLALQRELTSRVFAVASFVNVWEGNALNSSIFPDSSGLSQSLSDSLFSTSPASYLSPHHLSDFGAGYRLSKDILVQYTFSTNYGYSSSSHTLMLRYTLRAPKE